MRKLREESENEADTDASNARRDAARKRAARERQQRVEQALEELVKLKEQKEKRKKGSGKAARCSTTDPQARNMKMPGGGYRPADNVQFASDGKARVIISVDVTDLKVAQARAETRRAMAVATEQEFMATVQEMRAKVIEAEAQVPKAMAQAFREGNLGIMDYYRMKNIQADTGMRDSIAGPGKGEEDAGGAGPEPPKEG